MSRFHLLSTFAVLICAAPRIEAAAADLAILNQNATFNYVNDTNYIIVQAQGGAVKKVRAVAIEFKTEDGRYLPMDTIQLPDSSTDMAANSIQKIGFTLKSERLSSMGAYNGTVSVVGEAEAVSGQAPQLSAKTWTFKAQRNAVEFKIGDGSAKFPIVRGTPWSTAHAEIDFGFRVISNAQPSILPVIIPGVLTRSDGNPPPSIPGSSISGTLIDRHNDPNTNQGLSSSTLETLKSGNSDLHIISDIPSSENDVTGKLKIHSPDLKAEIEFPVTFNVKDVWFWPFLALLAGVLLSNLISTWSTKDRQHAMNLAKWEELNADLANFLSIHPGTDSDARFQTVQELLREAQREGIRKDFDSEKRSLDSAQTKLNDLKAAPPAAAVLPAAAVPPVPAVEITEPPEERTEDRILRFIITNAGAPPTGTVFTWRYTIGGGAPQPMGTATDRLSYQRRFPRASNYTVDVTYSGHRYTSAPFDVRQSPVTVKWDRINKTDWVITLFGVLLTTALAYIPYSKAATFGGVADYVLAFAGGFGLTEGTKGLAAVLTKIRS